MTYEADTKSDGESYITPTVGKYPAMDVARCVIEYFHKKKRKITNLPLQKLLFFIEKAALKETGESMIRENFHAWRLGPVIPGVYDVFSVYASSNILIPKRTPESMEIAPEDKKLIEKVLKQYLDTPVWDLVELSHRETPWRAAYEYGPRSKIRKEFMENMYSKKYN